MLTVMLLLLLLLLLGLGFKTVRMLHLPKGLLSAMEEIFSNLVESNFLSKFSPYFTSKENIDISFVCKL
jgi:hypothetical protein